MPRALRNLKSRRRRHCPGVQGSVRRLGRGRAGLPRIVTTVNTAARKAPRRVVEDYFGIKLDSGFSERNKVVISSRFKARFHIAKSENAICIGLSIVDLAGL